MPKNNQGVALIITILLMSLMLFLSIYFLNFSIIENKISKSQTLGNKAYYLAEAGINEMIWRLKNDQSYIDSFEDNPSWTITFSRTDPFGSGSGIYEVTIANSSRAHGEITSVGKYTIEDGKIAQRIIKTSVYKALGQSSIGDSAGYADGNVDISASKVNFYNGSSHSNNNFIVNNGSVISVDADLRATGNYIESWTSTSTIGGQIFAANFPPTPPPIDMPAVDFDSVAPSSYKNRANVIFTENQFKALLNNNTLTLNGITYVNGDVEIDKKIDLTINGLLVVEGDFEAGNTGNSSKPINITINHSDDSPAGILAKNKLELEDYFGSISGTGMLYATDQIDIINFQPGSSSFDITGGVVARKLTITSCWQPINITHDSTVAADVFPATEFSPTILIEHWEEEY